MTTALAERPTESTALVTVEQLDLIKRTIAKDATPDELKLYLYDCARQGVHPLDKLIHFTKRSGKYTPVTSIDFMRTRAADTGEYAGSDDALFLHDGGDDGKKPPASATVTVWRLVQGQRCQFTATARWSEYKPEQNDFMWKKMPHTMLGKCAEALALRKGFPRQLAGLYAKEEMDQADKGGGYVVEAPKKVENQLVAGNEHAKDGDPVYADVEVESDRDPGKLYVERFEFHKTKNLNVNKCRIVLSDGREVSTINPRLAALAEQCCQESAAIQVQTKTTKWGDDLIGMERADIQIDHGAPVLDSEIPFAWLMPLILPLASLALMGLRA